MSPPERWNRRRSSVAPGSDEAELRKKWGPFIHTHHYDVFDDFFNSWMAEHPRRTGEAYISQYWEAQLIAENPVPRDVATLKELVEWFQNHCSRSREHGRRTQASF